MRQTRAAILSLLARMHGRMPSPAEERDLVGRFGMDGDDASEFIDAYAAEFSVRMDGFRWYFHYLDEPPAIRRVVPRDAEGRGIPLMPLSVDLLVQAAETGAWMLTYPEHRVTVFPVGRIMLGVGAVVGFAWVWLRFRA